MHSRFSPINSPMEVSPIQIFSLYPFNSNFLACWLNINFIQLCPQLFYFFTIHSSKQLLSFLSLINIYFNVTLNKYKKKKIKVDYPHLLCTSEITIQYRKTQIAKITKIGENKIFLIHIKDT